MATLQELIELTPAQKKAWNKLVKAHGEFKAAGGKYYTVLDTLSGYNGQNVSEIDETGDHYTGDVVMPSFSDIGLSGFADDWHGFILNEGVEVEE